MAGSNQHTIPRFLLNGFASRTKAKEVYVWLYRKDGTVAEVNTRGVGSERYFYGGPGEQSVDETITRAENDYAALVARLRQHSGPVPPTDSVVPRFISHLSLRTRSFRQALAEPTATFLDRLFAHLRREETIRCLIRSDRFRAEAASKIRELGVDESRVDAVRQILLPSLYAWAEDRTGETSAILEELARASAEAFPGAIKRAHITALSEIPTNDKRAEFYARLRWFVLPTEGPLLLGDTACLFEVTGEPRFKPIHDADDELRRVFVPISARRLLAGTPYNKHPKVELRTVNRAIARCSHEFFVTSDRLPRASGLASRIGTGPGLLSGPEVDSIVKEVLGDLTAGKMRDE